MTDESQDKYDSSVLIDALNGLAHALRQDASPARFTEQHNYNAPPLNPVDIALTAEEVARRISSFNWDGVENASEYFSDLAAKVDWAKTAVAPQMRSSHAAVHSMLSLLFSVDLQMRSLVTPEVVDQSLRLPAELRRNVSRAKKTLDTATEAIDEVAEKLTVINAAHMAAVNLPTTQADLEQALKDVEDSRAAVLRFEAESKQLTSSSTDVKAHLDDLVRRADETIERVDHAFRSATSNGLAKAFTDKAKTLNRSMYLWAIALVSALVLAVCLGNARFPLILQALTPKPGSSTLDWGAIAVHALISLLSLGPAIWLAWVATKQIGQRFRLAEDYAYKAALSAAYEGYRSEAVGIDELMRAQLFSIALTRLDEIPLRVVDQDVPGSPMQELLKSKEFKEALEKSPDLMERVRSIFHRQVKKTVAQPPPAGEGGAS